MQYKFDEKVRIIDGIHQGNNGIVKMQAGDSCMVLTINGTYYIPKKYLEKAE